MDPLLRTFIRPVGLWKRLFLILSPFLAIVSVLVCLAVGSIGILTAARAYVEGESLWSKSQKEAVFHLLRFASTRAEADFQRYRKAIQVPLGFRTARLELQKPDRNQRVLWTALLQGGTHPEDIPGVIDLYDRFHDISYMKRVLEIWKTGDEFLSRLEAAADELHAYHETRQRDRARLARILDDIIQINEEITPWQNRFSNTLGEATRSLQSLLLLVVMAAAGTLVPIGVFLTQRVVNRVDHAERDLENLMETVPDVIFRLDREGRVVRWNKRLEHVLGLPSGEVANASVLDLFAEEDRDSIGGAFQRVLASGYAEVEAKLQPKMGAPIPYHWAGAAIRHADGTVIGLTAVGRNLRERKLLEEQLRQAQKMEAIGQLAGGIAHDFNNLLTVINGYSQLLLDDLEPGDPRRPHLLELRQAGGRAASLTHQLLTFSRKQVLSPKTLDLNAVLSRMSPMIDRLLGEHIQLQVHADPSLWPILADPGQIEQVVLNLAVNARDAMPRGGHLTIETGNVELDDLHAKRHPDLRPGPYVLLTVRDTGTGMDSATQARIFEPFFTTKELGKGTGLGLSTVYGIVKQSGGSIDVQTALGLGTTFRLYFPRTTAAAASIEPMPDRPVAPRGSETVLLVEDERQVRAFAANILRGRGYRVLDAASAEEALRLAEQHEGPLPLLVTDVVMPGMSGRELADRLGVLRPDLKVLFLSGYPDREIRRQGLDMEHVHFLHKPYTPEALALKVREVLDDHTDVGEASVIKSRTAGMG